MPPRFHGHREACIEIARVCNAHGLPITADDAYWAWVHWSQSRCSQWLCFDGGSEEAKNRGIIRAVEDWLASPET